MQEINNCKITKKKFDELIKNWLGSFIIKEKNKELSEEFDIKYKFFS